MLSWITETQTVWQRMQSCQKPVVIYGMGDGALKIMKVMEGCGVRPAAIFASDDFVRGQSFVGYPVLRLDQVEEQFADFLIVMAFGVHDEPTIRRVMELSRRRELVAPDVPVAGEELFDLAFVQRHEAELDWLYRTLADERSRQTLAAVVNYKISGKLNYLEDCALPEEEAYRDLLQLGPEEDFADLGAYRGDTIAQMLHYAGGCRSITALEPDAKTFRKLCAKVEELGVADRARCCNLAAWSGPEQLTFNGRGGRMSALLPQASADQSPLDRAMAPKKEVPVQADSLDRVCGGQRVSFLNMDVEGSERQALEGCRQTICRWQPKMLLAAYHRSEDLFAIARQVQDICPGYRFYLRHHHSIPAWDTNLYALPPKAGDGEDAGENGRK